MRKMNDFELIENYESRLTEDITPCERVDLLQRLIGLYATHQGNSFYKQLQVMFIIKRLMKQLHQVVNEMSIQNMYSH